MVQIDEKKGGLSRNIRAIFQTVFMIKKILIVHQETSLPVYENVVEITGSFEAAMISGIMQAISTIGQEMIGRPTGFKKLLFHGFSVTGAYSEGFTIYVFSEAELVKEIEDEMQNLIKWFSKTFQSQIYDWDGRMNVFQINKTIIDNKVCQHLFLWLLYPVQTTKDQSLDRSELSNLSKLILDCIDKAGGCTSAKILDDLQNYKEERILFEIYYLVKNGFLETSTND